MISKFASRLTIRFFSHRPGLVKEKRVAPPMGIGAAILMLVLLLASLACTLPAAASRPTVTPVPSPVPASTQDSKELQQQIATASAKFSETGELSLTLTEKQIDALLLEAISQQADLQVTDPQVFLQNGEITFTGKTVIAKLDVAVQIVFKPVVSDGLLTVEVVSANFGKIPVPDSFLKQITELVNKNLNEHITVDGRQIQIETVQVGDGKLTITGKAR